MHLLITSAGRRNHLISCFREDAASLNLPLRILAADFRPEFSPACRQADAHFAVPHCADSDYVPTLLKLCREHEVRVLVPAIDPELPILSAHRAAFAAIGTHVVVSGPEAVAVSQDKGRTAEVLLASGIATPRTLSLADYLHAPKRLQHPVIAKPRTGSASQGIVRPNSAEELTTLNPQDYIVQELWEGREFTVNVFFDRAGRMRCAVPHERLEVRAGEVSKGVTRRHPQLEEVAWRLPAALSDAAGPLCFQAIVRDSGEIAVFEINARFGGGFPLAHRAGAPFTRWLLEEAIGCQTTAADEWRTGLTMLRYDAAVFFDE